MDIDYSGATKDVQYYRFTTEVEPALPDYLRYFSADPRMPFSIVYPRELTPVYDHNEYRGGLSVTFGQRAFSVVRTDLLHAGREGLAVAQGDVTVVEFVKATLDYYRRVNMGAFAGTKRVKIIDRGSDIAHVGESGFIAPRALWERRDGTQGEWVFFVVNSQMWNISREPTSELADIVFRTIQRSFRFLKTEYFHSLGIRW